MNSIIFEDTAMKNKKNAKILGRRSVRNCQHTMIEIYFYPSDISVFSHGDVYVKEENTCRHWFRYIS